MERSGQHDVYRKAYLDWFRGYLLSRGVEDAEIWKALYDAMEKLHDVPGGSGRKWYLRVAEGNQARLVQNTDDSDVLRIEIDRNMSSQP